MTDATPAPGSLDVLGIGNALVDVLCHVDEAFIEANGLEKGSMTLIDTERAEELYGAMGSSIEASGWTTSPTMSPACCSAPSPSTGRAC